MKLNKAKFYYKGINNGMSLEDFQRNAIFNETDTYDDCAVKLSAILDGYNPESHWAWWFFKEVSDDIPVEHRLPLLFNLLYDKHPIPYEDLLIYLSVYLYRDETPELKELRAKRVEEQLSDYLDSDGEFSVYYAMGQGYPGPEADCRAFLNPYDALSCVAQYMKQEPCSYGGIHHEKEYADNVLWCNNEDDVFKVFITPLILSDEGFIIDTDFFQHYGNFDVDEALLNIYSNTGVKLFSSEYDPE